MFSLKKLKMQSITNGSASSIEEKSFATPNINNTINYKSNYENSKVRHPQI